jgi:hypothetical protein
MEDYEQEVHPYWQGFWKDLPRNRKHPYGKHPAFSVHGDKLARAAHKWFASSEKIAKFAESHPEAINRAFMQIMRIEQAHSAELVALAAKITSDLWGIPPDRLKGFLTTDVDPGDNFDDVLVRMSL